MKPVAWMQKETYEELLIFKQENPKAFKKVIVNPRINFNDDVPLYTAPRELSDEELYYLHESYYGIDETGQWNLDYKAFARAILKKASEK